MKKKKLLIMVLILLLIPICMAIEECKKITLSGNVPCRITSTWNYTAPCTSHQATVYNSSALNIINYTFGDYGLSGLCNITFNLTSPGSYIFLVDNGDSGNILVEGDNEMISFSVMTFLIIFNIGIFILPLFIKSFTKNKPTDYILRNLIFITGILFLWLICTILRTMALNANLGIDDLLQGVWWFITLLASICIFAIVYVTTVGVMNMLKEAQMRIRMGDNEYG